MDSHKTKEGIKGSNKRIENLEKYIYIYIDLSLCVYIYIYI